MEKQNQLSLATKISVTLLCILGSSGVIFFFEAVKNLTPEKLEQIFWATLFGISFSYVLGYKLEIRASKPLFKKK